MINNLFDWCTSGPWKTNKETDTQWKFDVIDNTLYITFQGSVSKLDWKQNFDFFVKPYKYMPVTWYAHRGFVEKWHSVRDAIMFVVGHSSYNNIVVTGFSQGAALATLCHEDVMFNFVNKDLQTVIYGSPRVLWFWNFRTIRKRFKTVTSYTITNDCVPKVPPMLFGYRHVGNRHKLRSKYCIFKFAKVHMSYDEYNY